MMFLSFLIYKLLFSPLLANLNKLLFYLQYTNDIACLLRLRNLQTLFVTVNRMSQYLFIIVTCICFSILLLS